MENASKALLMAAGVLIGLLILSLAVYLFASFGTTSAEIHKQNEENQLNQFNGQFTSYVGKEGITIYDVVSVANLATESNIYYEFDKRATPTDGKDNYISVIFKNSSINGTYNRKTIEKAYGSNTADIQNYYNELISLDLQNMNITSDAEKSDLTQYECQVEISNTTQRVYRVTFSKKNI